MRVLIITADDWGYAPAYDRGIQEAAAAGAIDAVSAMVTRDPGDAAGLLETGVAVGLHLDLPPIQDRAGEEQRRAAVLELERQLAAFEERFGRPPAHLDGHHHSHAAPGLAAAIARAARERGLPMRSTDERHRRLLRCLGIPTPDRLIGRISEAEPAPPELIADLPEGISEWMVHPGHADPGTGSEYDAAREDDLRLLLGFGDRDAWHERGIQRAGHAEALRSAGAP